MNSKFTDKTGGKLVAVATSVATTISLSGISLLAPIFIASAATIVDGDIVKTTTSFDVYIAKHVGTKKFKRLILSPHVFASYSHLKWSNLKTVTQAEMDAYTTSDLVRAVGDPKVYKLSSALDSDTGTRQWVNMTAAEFVSAGNDWDSIYEINSVDRDAYTSGADVTPTGVTPAPVGAGVSVSLASDTPAASTIAGGATDHVFTKVNFVGGANTTVTSVLVTRSGLAEDDDFAAIKLWDGATQLGGTQALNTVTHKATFTGLSWVVPAGTTKVLTISGTLNTLAGGATTGNTPRLGIGAAADVVATTAVSGTFPAHGNAMTIAGIGVGILDVTARTVPADSSPVAGATEVEIASWTFDAETEGMSVRRIKVTQTGSASAVDVKNIMLKVDGVRLGSTVASLASDGTAVFDLSSSPYGINSGVSKIVFLYADISSGIVTGTTTRSIDFEITNAADVTAFGANSSGSITITTDAGGDSVTYTTQSGVAQTVGQGTIPTVAVNGATNPSAQNFVRGTTQQLFSAFRFSNGVAQDVRIARLRLNLLGNGAGAVDISNVTLYKYDEATGVETQVGTPTNFVGTVATYGADAPGLDTGIFDILKGKNFVLHARADVSTSASWTTIEIALNEVRIDGIQSQANMDPIVVTTVDGLGEVRTHLAHSAVGTLTVALAPSNPAAQNIVPGKLGQEYAKIDFRANGEDITLSTLIFQLQDNALAAASGDFTNVKLWDGSTQIGSTVASPTSSATFSVNVTIKKDTTKTFTVTVDVPTNAATVWAGATRVRLLWTTNSTDVVATGVGSTASVVATTADLNGNNMTALAETVTVAFQPLPSATVVVSSSGIVISRAVLAAGNAGNVNISSMTFSLDDATTLDGASAADSSVGSLGLYDGATLLKTGVITGGTPDTVAFTGLNVTVPKGTQKVFDVKANALVAGTFFTGFADLTGGGTATDVVGTGLLSNTTVYGTGTNAANSGGLTIAAEGTLNVSVDAATPVASFVAVGTAGVSGVDFAKFRFAANTEAVDMEQLVITLPQDNNTGTNNNDVANFSSIQLFDGSAAVSSKVFPTGNNDLAAVAYTFTFSPEFRIPKDSFKVLTLKGDLNGTASGANSTTTPRFHIADVAGDTDGAASNITARGVGSAQRLTSSATGSNPETAANVNEMTIARSKPVMSLCTSSNCTKASPTGALLPGVTEVIRFRVEAEGDDVVFNGTNHNIRFTIAQSGGAVTGRNAILYEVGKTAALQTVSAIDLTAAGTINFDAITTTISKSTFKEYYATVDLTDYATTGETFRLSIEAAAADVSWGDGVTLDITNTPSVTNLPVVGGTLVK